MEEMPKRYWGKGQRTTVVRPQDYPGRITQEIRAWGKGNRLEGMTPRRENSWETGAQAWGKSRAVGACSPQKWFLLARTGHRGRQWWVGRKQEGKIMSQMIIQMLQAAMVTNLLSKWYLLIYLELSSWCNEGVAKKALPIISQNVRADFWSRSST